MTMMLKVDPLNPNEETMKKAAQVVKRGGVVVFPTETVYGMGANCFDVNAVLKIFQIKKRPTNNPLIVHICDFDQLQDLVVDSASRKTSILKTFWPGPVTFIFKKKSAVPKEVTGGLETIAVRMPSHPVAQMLIELSETPIAAPSANLSGRPSPTREEHVVEDLYGLVDVIIESGETPLGIESTIVDMSRDTPVLLRPGAATVEDIRKTLPDIKIPEFVVASEMKPEKTLAPGMSYRHYAPRKPLVLVINRENLDTALKKYPDAVILCSLEDSQSFKDRHVITLGTLEQPFTIAQNLFHALRTVDNLPQRHAIALGFEPRGILFSVMNRLRKAASEII